MFQSFNLLPYATAFENVELPMLFMGVKTKTRKEKTMELLDKVGLAKRARHKPNELSGGEMQRVAIALCLARECDLYLLDEPSAYLDVDQRLVAAKLIRGNNSIVIDHDLLFLSYIADRAMLFSGEPGKEGKAKCIQLQDGFNEFLK